MPRKAPITKMLCWRNINPILSRWDMEIVHADGTRERVTDIGDRFLKRLLKLIERLQIERKDRIVKLPRIRLR